MAKIDERDLAVGRLYAEAMLGLAEERGQSEALLDELKDLVEFLDRNPKVEHFLASQMVDEEGGPGCSKTCSGVRRATCCSTRSR